MDGIFGVGLAEMLIIGLALFIIGGPENTAKWAREAGRIMRKVRRSWEEVMSEMERELGPDGKELMDATRELGRSAHELRTMSSPRRLMSETARLIDPPPNATPKAGRSMPAESAPAASSNDGSGDGTGDGTESNGSKYRAWLPPEDN